MKKALTVAFPGVPGAYSEAATLACYPDAATLPLTTFKPCFDSVQNGTADLAVIPVENLIAGRVADVYALLPDSGLFIIGEHFQPIEHHLLALPGTTLNDIKLVTSHVQALTQCTQFLRTHNLPIENHADTAGAAADVAKLQDKTIAAIASARAGELYGLQSVAVNIADRPDNKTRFLVLARDAQLPDVSVPSMTSLIFTVKSVPAALHKALGGFANHGINLTKIESYITEADFTSSTFYVDVAAHPALPAMQNALQELGHYTSDIQLLGTYPQAEWRLKNSQN